MALPYRLLLICLLLTGITFSLGPWWAMRSIQQAALADNKEQWPHWVKQEGFNDYAGRMLDGLAKLKMNADMESNPAVAIRKYQDRTKAMPKAVQQLTSPLGFSHLLCGDLLGEADAKPADTTGCWALDGKLTWQSPVQAKVTFINPQTQWQSSLTLLRVGLFTWQADGIVLPVETLIDRYAESIGLKADEKQI